jgi:hypothetical protein
MTPKIKKTYELDEETISTIQSIAECLAIPEREVIEMAISKPKLLEAASKVCKLKKETMQ